MSVPLSEATAALINFHDDLFAAVVDQFDVIARETAGRAVGGTMTLHGRGGKRTPVTLGTRSVVIGHGLDAEAIVVGTPKAMWVWLEHGTRPHQIGRRRVDGKVVYLHGARYEHPIAGPIEHKGSHAKSTWTATVNAFRAEFPTLAVTVKGEVFGHAQ